VRRKLVFTAEAAEQLGALGADQSKKGLYRQILKTLGLLEIDTRHPGLNTHECTSLEGINSERIWETYVQNKTPGAYRIFFHYGPDEGTARKRVAVLTVVAVTPHP
jgi:hypothetical protein